MKRAEQSLQMTLADHLRARAAASTYWFHPANGGARTAIEGAILKACGVRAGTPDLILIKDGKTFGLELQGKWWPRQRGTGTGAPGNESRRGRSRGGCRYRRRPRAARALAIAAWADSTILDSSNQQQTTTDYRGYLVSD
jgi:hypothetical protein